MSSSRNGVPIDKSFFPHMRRWDEKEFTDDDRALLVLLASEANFVPSEYRHRGMGINIPVGEGQVPKSRGALARELGWTEDKVRHRLKRLVGLGELSIATYRRGQKGTHLITVVALREIYLTRTGKKLTTHSAPHSRQALTTTYVPSTPHSAPQLKEVTTSPPPPSHPPAENSKEADTLPSLEGPRPPNGEEQEALAKVLTKLGLEAKAFMLGPDPPGGH